MDIVHVVGNRPQFIKLAPVYHALKKLGINSLILHSGQHYDSGMSEQFFEEFNLPSDHVRLKCLGNTHGAMTGELMIKIENYLLQKTPKMVLVYGDTNTTLAGALVAVKLNIPILHVEAGPRLGSFDTPEEVNRVVVDRISDILISVDANSTQNLLREGRKECDVYEFGDVVFDAFNLVQESPPAYLNNEQHNFIIATFHRPQNVDIKISLENMLKLFQKLDYDIIFPMHPRTKASINSHNLTESFSKCERLTILDPIGFSQMKWLIKRCAFVITDSGGLQREAYFGGKQAKIAIPQGPWPSLEKSGWIKPINWFSHATSVEVEQWTDMNSTTIPAENFGGGQASLKIAELIKRMCDEN